MCSGSYLLKRILDPVWKIVEVGRKRSREDSWETIEVFQVRGDGGFDQGNESENERIIVKEELTEFND